ncbi:MAG: hypothetical protein ACRC6V_10565 [Bacteroidales bacterium]
MSFNMDTGFDNDERLLDIRQSVLNPIAVKVAGLGNKVTVLEDAAKDSLKGAVVDVASKTITFPKGTGSPIIANLDGMFREGSDLKILDGADKVADKVHEVKFADSLLIQSIPGEIEVHYDWGGLVKKHQQDVKVGKSGGGLGYDTEGLFFKGTGVKVEGGAMGITTVTIPEPTKPLSVALPGKPAEDVTDVSIEGQVGTSFIKDGKLTLDLAGGGVTPFATQNFQGFYESLGDLQSHITNPVDGKTFAFAKDIQAGGKFYTPYFYVNGSWQELKQDPAITYEDPSSVGKVGVYSIKPNPRIKVDALGQMDLDGLSTPAAAPLFHGFYNDVNDLKAAVPKPTLDLSFAYVKHASGSGWEGLRYVTHGTSTRKWETVSAIGGFSVIDKKVGPTKSSAGFGIYQNNDFDIDSKGILSLKPIDTTTDIIISDYQGDTTGGKINQIHFENGKNFVEVLNNELTIQHPQRVINYANSWELAHTSENYRGNIFYDATSNTWMGWADPKAGGGVGKKWTRIAHEGMSDEVKDLVRRVPAKAPEVVPGVLLDNPSWAYNGITYLDRDDTSLPDELQGKCGGYITTSVQDKDLPDVTIPQNRIQSCAADRAEGGTWVRRFVSTGTPGSQTSWSDWVRTSFSHKDIEAHQKDFGAHKDVIRYHVVFALTGKMSAIFSQTAGDSLGGLHEDNGLMIVDNYGYTNQDKDYMDPPYAGKFRISGTLSFSGYKENEKKFPTGRWQILFRKKDKDGANYAPVAQFTYDHTDDKVQYPPLSFLAKDIQLEDHQEVVINISFNDSRGLMDKHPDIYLAPTRTFLVLEDNETTSGTLVAEAHRKLYGNLDVIGDVGIKSHHSRLNDPNSSIRVYGEKLNKTPKEMNYIS